jgi:CrcB protein
VLSLSHLLLIGIGGSLGAVARVLVANALAVWLGPHFPFGTFFVNVSGSFAIGALLAFLTPRGSDAVELRAFLVVGFLGAYTTYSTFTYETLALFQAGRLVAALVNLAGQLVLGLAAVVLGVVAVRSLT